MSAQEKLERARAIAAKLSAKAAQAESEAPQEATRKRESDTESFFASLDSSIKRVATGDVKPRHGLGMADSSYGPPRGFDKDPTVQIEEMYPASVVGLIIGRQGETLKRIQNTCNIKLQFEQDAPSHETERRATFIGAREDINVAKQMIDDIIGKPGGGGKAMLNLYSSDPNKTTVEIEVPATKVGLIIGKGGETIRSLEQQSGARMAVVTDPPADGNHTVRYVTCCGDDIAIATARRLINDIIFQQPKEILPPGCIKEIVQVPQDRIGLVIGKGGETIKSIQASAQCTVKVDPTPGSIRNVIFIGPQDRVDHAKMLVDERVTSKDRRPGEPYAGGQDYYGQYAGYGAGAGGGEDYSAQWEEYYRNQALWNQYYASTGQTPDAASTGAVEGGAVTGDPQGQVDYTEQWNEYYRQMGYDVSVPGTATDEEKPPGQ